VEETNKNNEMSSLSKISTQAVSPPQQLLQLLVEIQYFIICGDSQNDNIPRNGENE
jgi:hypothetical protein